MDWLSRELRVGSRRLAKDRVFTATSLLTLAICIGANTALFAVVYNVLLRPLPVPEADRLVIMGNVYPNAGVSESSNSSVPDYYDRRRDVSVLSEQAFLNHGGAALGRDEGAERVHLANVTPSYFRLLEVQPILGRAFVEEEGQVGNERKVVLSEGLWKTRFGGDPSVVGRDVRLDRQQYTVVGVMPKEIEAFDPNVALWRPLAFTPEERSDDKRHNNNYTNLGRLKKGATLQQAQAQVDALNTANLDRFPKYKDLLVKAGFHTVVESLPEHLVKHVKPTLHLLWGGALFVLLIGCVNVANLALVRARARAKELATRLALGAGPGHLVRQLLVESVLLSLGAAALGIGLGAFALRGLGALHLEDLPYGASIGLSAPVVLVTVLGAVLIGIAVGLVPVFLAVPANLALVIREEGRSTSAGHGARVLRRVLVIAQVAFTFVLLVGAGLLFASFQRVLKIDPGFRSDHVLTASVTLPKSRYADDPSMQAFAAESLRRVRALPGVVAAGITDTIPFGQRSSDSVILAEGYQMKPEESVISPWAVSLTPGAFEALNAKLVKGRFFRESDTAGAPGVIMVDEKLARRFWPGRDPIGRRMYKPTDINNLLAVNEKTVFLTVVGVIADMKLHDLTEGDKAVGAYYTPIAQDASRTLTYAVRTTGDPMALASSLRHAVASVDPELPLYQVQTMEQLSATALLDRRSPAMLSLAFGFIALLLSAVGIYGVLAYLVTQRSKEIGIRIALGSSTRAIFELVLREGLLLIGLGFGIGAALALGLRRTLDSLLYGIHATDPLVLVATTLLLAAVAFLACAVPARRATRIDPIIVLTE
jgi:predicted permease